MTDRTSGIAGSGNGFPVAAFSILAYQEAAVLSIDRQQAFSALGTPFIGQVVMAEGSFTCADFSGEFSGLPFNILDKSIFLQLSFCNL